MSGRLWIRERRGEEREVNEKISFCEGKIEIVENAKEDILIFSLRGMMYFSFRWTVVASNDVNVPVKWVFLMIFFFLKFEKKKGTCNRQLRGSRRCYGSANGLL